VWYGRCSDTHVLCCSAREWDALLPRSPVQLPASAPGRQQTMSAVVPKGDWDGVLGSWLLLGPVLARWTFWKWISRNSLYMLFGLSSNGHVNKQTKKNPKISVSIVTQLLEVLRISFLLGEYLGTCEIHVWFLKEIPSCFLKSSSCSIARTHLSRHTFRFLAISIDAHGTSSCLSFICFFLKVPWTSFHGLIMVSETPA